MLLMIAFWDFPMAMRIRGYPGYHQKWSLNCVAPNCNWVSGFLGFWVSLNHKKKGLLQHTPTLGKHWIIVTFVPLWQIIFERLMVWKLTTDGFLGSLRDFPMIFAWEVDFSSSKWANWKCPCCLVSNYPLVICYITMENHHRNRGFSHE